MHGKVVSPISTDLNISNSLNYSMKGKNGNLILSLLTVLFFSLTAIFEFIVVYFNNKFINEYVSTNSIDVALKSEISTYNGLFSLLAYLSFGIFLVLSFVLLRKILKNKSKPVNIVSLVFFEGFIVLTMGLLNYYSKFYYSKILFCDCYLGYVNSDANPNYYNLASLFSNLEIISILAFFGFLFWISFSYVIFNLTQDRTIFIQNTADGLKGSDDSDKSYKPSVYDNSLIFINKNDSSSIPQKCSKCNSPLTLTDKYCSTCGELVSDRKFIL